MTRRIPRLPSELAFTLAIAFAVGVFTWYSRAIHDFFVPDVIDVVVPTFVGQNEADALALGRREKLQMLVITRRTSEQFPKGVIMVQDPSGGVQVRENRRISLIVSDGVQYVSMPDLRDQTMRQAELILSNLHLHVGKTKNIDNNDIDAGHIVSVDPAPLTNVKQGTNVNFELSNGPPSNITVPDFTGMQVDDARTLASSSKIRIGQIVWTPFGSNGPPRGAVVRQKPAAASNIDGHGNVSLQVSAGPHQFGYMIRETHASVTVPLADSSAHVRVLAIDENGSHPAFDAFGASGQHIDFTATTVGTAHLETYINGTIVDTTPLGREPKSQEEEALEAGSVTRVDPKSLTAPSPSPSPTAKATK